MTLAKKRFSQQDLQSILESTLFTLGRPLSLKELSSLFATEQMLSSEIKEALSALTKGYQSDSRGIELKEVAGSYQLITKEENKTYIRKLVKGRLFQLSAPALEVLVIVAYRQNCTKASIDEIRGVESGHLLRTLMEKDLVSFGPKSSDPGHYMTYKTTPKFLEVFGLKNLKALPSSEDVADLLASTDTQTPEEGESLKAVLNQFQPGSTSSSSGSSRQKSIDDELERVSGKLKNIKPKMILDETISVEKKTTSEPTR